MRKSVMVIELYLAALIGFRWTGLMEETRNKSNILVGKPH
jgi:hypothetical protein